MTTRRRLIATLLTCMLIFTLFGQGAAESMTVYVGKDSAPVYDAAGQAIGAVPLNTKLQLTGVKGSVAQVSYGGHTGYMKKSHLSAAPSGTTTQAAQAAGTMNKTVYANKDAGVYDASGSAIGAVSVNTRMTCTAVKGKVCQVKLNGRTGYMKKGDLSESPVAVPEAALIPEIAPTAAPEAINATAYVNRDGATVYNAKGKAVNRAALNTRVTVIAVKDGVCQVKAEGKIAYMSKSDLSSAMVEVAPTPSPTPQTICESAFVAKAGAKVYDAHGSVIATLGLNAAVTVTAVKGKVCRVTTGGRTGYMNAEDLSCDRVETQAEVVDIPDTTGYVNKEGAKVYDASGSTIATLGLNAAVTVSAYSDSLVQVVNGSLRGYMAKGDVSTSQVVTATYTLKYGDSGEAVKRIQSRLKALGYFAGTIGGNYQGLTQAAVQAFQSQAKLTVSGECDEKTLEALFSDSAPKQVQTADNPAGTGKSTATPARGTARNMDWWTSGIQGIFAKGTTATITDVATGLAWREQRRGGTNHADVQPLTAADTAVLKRAYGGKWSWTRRAIFVTINGVNYAASMNGMPHGSGSISGNNFNGHHCIHFTNSRTHGSNKVCSLHQAAIKKALTVKL